MSEGRLIKKTEKEHLKMAYKCRWATVDERLEIFAYLHHFSGSAPESTHTQSDYCFQGPTEPTTPLMTAATAEFDSIALYLGLVYAGRCGQHANLEEM